MASTRSPTAWHWPFENAAWIRSVRDIHEEGLRKSSARSSLPSGRTAPRAGLCIELGYDPETRVYFIRHNGIGFDMAGGDLLFNPSTQLHFNTESG